MTGPAETRSWRLEVLVVALAVIVMAPTLVLGRIDFDDLWLWGDDSPLRRVSSDTLRLVWLETSGEARRPLGSEYLPVRDMAVMLDMFVWGDGEHGPHATQLVLYALSVFGLGRLLIGFGFSRTVAWTATLLWALHPLHVESVAWLSERKGVLSGLFVIACGHAWLRYRANGRRLWLALACLAAVAGVWSKAPAMFGPAAFLAWDMLLLPAHRRRWIAAFAVGACTAAAAVPVIAVAADRKIIDEEAVQAEGRVVSSLGAHGHYAQSLVLARSPSISYPIQTEGPSPLDLGAGAAVIAVSLVALRRRREWRAVVAWAWIWFLPISHLVVPVHIAVADRFAYLWSLAGCLAMALGLARLRPQLATIIAAGLACVLAVATIRAQVAWTNERELYGRAHRANPDDARACLNYANALAGNDRAREAVSLIGECVARRPLHPYLLARQAALLERTGATEAAYLASEQGAVTGKASVMWEHAVRASKRGDHLSALAWARRAAERRPEVSLYHETIGTELLELGRDGEAIAPLTVAAWLEPRSERIRELLVRARAGQR